MKNIMSPSINTLSMPRIIIGVTLAIFGQIADCPAADIELVKPPTCQRATGTHFELDGIMADYLRAVTRQWLLIAPDANPGMLEIFRDRDRQPPRAMEPWAGEFAGKYLTGAVQVYRVTHDEELRKYLTQFVQELCSLQAEDGYLGPWPRASRLTGTAPNVGKGAPGSTWDAWGHYHVMLGLLLWAEETGDKRALQAAVRIGDLMRGRFLGPQKPRLVDTGSTEMNLAPVHSLCLLYQATGDSRYLDLAKQLADEFAARDDAGKPLAGDYINAAISQEFFQTPKPRWESLHPMLSLPELFYLTGDDRYRNAFEHWWWSIVKLDRHNNGGFSSGEQAQGNPYHQGAIETCCTIAWMAMTTEMLKLTGNSLAADELELSTLNSGLGMHSPTGRWATYNTPMDGVRKASAHDIVFQSREGTPELNCCSVNSARGLGLLSEWAVMRDSDGLLLNWLGPGKINAQLADGRKVSLRSSTEYPRDGHIVIEVTPAEAGRFSLRLRIPAWSAESRVTINGEAAKNVEAAKYLVLDRDWQAGDRIEMDLDFSLRYWVGERESAGKVSIYRGPLLLAYDRRFNSMDPADVPALDAHGLQGKRVSLPLRRSPFLLLEFGTDDCQALKLCDFASAGHGGTPYLTWLRVNGVVATPFSRTNPSRSGRVLEP
jgi:DUF1680 family protein